jgi:hypothetical protein
LTASELFPPRGDVAARSAQREAEAHYRERSDDGILTVGLMNVAA